MSAEREPIVSIPRIYTDASGVTRFTDTMITGVLGRSPVSTAQAVHGDSWSAESLQWRRIISEDVTGSLHNAPARQLAVQLIGTAEYETSSGEVRQVEQGGVILLDDVEGPGHTARSVGDTARVSIFIRLGPDVVLG